MPWGMIVLWFSRDRAFQLRAALDSFDKFSGLDKCAQHIVIYNASDGRHAASYDALARQRSHVRLVHDDEADLTTLAANALTDGAVTCFVGVDDWLAFDALQLPALSAALLANDRILSFNLTLHPGVNYSQPSARALQCPPLRLCGSSCFYARTDVPDGLLSDFGLPVSVSGSLFRLADWLLILRSLSASDVSHPNRLEVAANRLVTVAERARSTDRGQSALALVEHWQHGAPKTVTCMSLDRPLTGCLDRVRCCVITVNRVQTIFSNPVIDTPGQDASTTAMLAAFEASTLAMDYAAYRHRAAEGQYTAVHIGDFLTVSTATSDR